MQCEKQLRKVSWLSHPISILSSLEGMFQPWWEGQTSSNQGDCSGNLSVCVDFRSTLVNFVLQVRLLDIFGNLQVPHGLWTRHTPSPGLTSGVRHKISRRSANAAEAPVSCWKVILLSYTLCILFVYVVAKQTWNSLRPSLRKATLMEPPLLINQANIRVCMSSHFSFQSLIMESHEIVLLVREYTSPASQACDQLLSWLSQIVRGLVC